ncbi:cnh domain containing [Anaeramoeba ignava]|uniref:Cnh domain containing n=1 Tax=Anaeramoeba ignava TaxID=1746090 RepID=A0A9Q0LGR2_ANAIG|nr:cnh domain containing [Anaeramoeba ignava]
MEHRAFEIQLISTEKFKIECLTTYSNKLLIGKSDGNVIVHEVTKEQNKYVFSKSQQFSLSNKPILQLEALPKINMILALTNHYVSIFSLDDFKPLYKLKQTKGAHLIAVHPTSQQYHFVVAMKKKLITFYWSGNNIMTSKDITLIDIPKTMEWIQYQVCIGFKKGYTMFTLNNLECSDLLPGGKSGNPYTAKISEKECLVGRDHISIFYDANLKPTRQHGIVWGDTPLVTTFHQPYLIGVLPEQIEIRTIDSKKLVQKLAYPGIKIISNKNNLIYLATTNSIYRMYPVPLIEQATILVKQNEYIEALQLCELIGHDEMEKEQKDEKIREIKTKFAFYLFHTKQFAHSMDLFKESECDVRSVISLFSNFIQNVIQNPLQDNPFPVPKLQPDEVEQAILALIDFLTQKRRDPDVNEDDLTLIDTVIVKAYLKTNAALIGSFLRFPNHCDLEEGERILKNNRPKELIELYASKKKHKQALELLEQEEFAKGKIFSIVKYLQYLGSEDLDLIFRYTDLIRQVDPEQVLEIFTFEPSNENPRNLPVAQVKEYLSSRTPENVVPYLTHVIYVKKDQTPAFHNDLLLGLLEEVVLLNSKIKMEIKKNPDQPDSNLMELKKKYFQLRKKMYNFLEDSKFYTPEKMLSRFPQDDLFEEKALLLSRLNQHEKALEIYIHNLDNFEKAEEYCQKYYSQEGESEKVYFYLLKQYLAPLKSEPNIQKSFEILNRYHQKINPEQVFAILPKDLYLLDLYPYIDSVMNEKINSKRTYEITKNLLKAEIMNFNTKLVQAKSRYVRIQENTKCCFCDKRIASSAFSVYPNGDLVHFGCKKDYEEKIEKEKNF